VWFLFKTPAWHAGTIKGEGQPVTGFESEQGRKMFRTVRQCDPADSSKAGRMTPVPEIDPDDFAFFGFFGVRFDFNPIHSEFRNGKLLVAFRIDRKMQIAAVGTKARENIVVAIAVIPTNRSATKRAVLR